MAIDKIFKSDSEEERPAEAILVSVFIKGEDDSAAIASLNELERLLETAGGVCFAKLIQNKEHPDNATYIGKGKLEELGELCKTGGVSLCIFDCELTPSQIRNIENALSTEGDVRVIDRSMLILDIFALHAVTGEGKLQVELAQLKYTAPRLTGRGKDMSRLGGGIGTRGPGESKLESDRRHLAKRAAALEEQIREMAGVREVQRRQRDKTGITKFAIAGYTNAGKSTLLNRLTGAGILAEDKLFATLDPTTRKFELPSGRQILLTDTVGFIRNLPHHLIKAFKSTLDEVKFADAIIVMIDASDSECKSQLEVTSDLLLELGAADKDIIYVFNKCDSENCQFLFANTPKDDTVMISALTGQGIEALIDKIEQVASSKMQRLELFIPNSEMAAIDIIYKNGSDIEMDYTPEGVRVMVTLDAASAGKMSKYKVE